MTFFEPLFPDQPGSGVSGEPALPEGACFTVLLIDSNPVSAVALASLISGRGHECLHCAAYEEAAPRLPEADLILLRLTPFTAAEAAHFLRSSDHSGCLVAGVTDGAPPGPEADSWMQRGVDDFMPDPSSAGETAAAERLTLLERRVWRRRAARHTARAAGDGRYEALFHCDPAAALVVTAGGSLIVEANPAAAAVLGFSPAELTGGSVRLLLPGLFDCPGYAAELPEGAGARRLSGIPHQGADGRTRRLEVIMTRLPWSSGPAWLLRIHDQTMLRQEESRRLRESRMEAAAHALQGAAGALSDILTPLRGHLELLARRLPARGETLELMHQAGLACGRAESLGSRFGRLANPAGSLPLRCRPVALPDLIRTAVPRMLLHRETRPVFALPEHLWAVQADPAALEAALRHLVDNACEAMNGAGTVVISAGNVPAPGLPDSVQVTIRDEGHGIAPEHSPRVCDPWFTTRPGREGMGLAHAGAVIRAHGGHLDILSSGSGTAVTLTLPASGVRPPPPEARPRILFMDDEAPVRDVLQKILTAHGCEVHVTASGGEAIDAWCRASELGTPFDLILVDLEVRGGMGGLETVACLRRRFPGLKALLTTGYPDDGLMESCREHGFLGIIPKPFHLDRLVQTVTATAALPSRE